MMRNFFFIAGFLAASAPVFAEVSLKIVQPYENSTLPFVRRSFVFGSVSPASATLTINGIPVKPHTNGGFLAMIPLEPGKFKLDALATEGLLVSSMTRTINVEPAVVALPTDHPHLENMLPKVRWVVRADDIIDVSFQGAPGGTAEFRFSGKGRAQSYPMEEDRGAVQGIYRGAYRVLPGDDLKDEDVLFTLKRKDGKKITGKSGAHLISQSRHVGRILELKEDAVLLTGPDGDLGYSLFLLEGTRLELTGEKGDYFRVNLGGGESGWIKAASAMELPAGTLPARSVSRNIRIRALEASTVVEIPLQFRHPHRIDEFLQPFSLRVKLYGVVADTDRIRFRSQDSAVQEVFWHQTAPDVMTIDIQTKLNYSWGYDVRYDGNLLILEIRNKPVIKGKGQLQGVKVAVDAGHSIQSYGTIGPTGNTEFVVNMLAAQALKKELESRGATVLMTQDGTREISLQERVNTAWRERAHFFISLHADACDVGLDPREIDGYSVHYYHPHSKYLAETIHALYGRRSGFRDQGLWRSNLAVCRATQMPSILLEQGFLIIPESEELLMSSKNHRIVADSVADAIAKVLEKK